MKLLRYGPAGKEKPGLLDSNGKILQRKIRQKRVNNEVFSHSSLFYLATSSTISNSINKENDLNSEYVFSF